MPGFYFTIFLFKRYPVNPENPKNPGARPRILALYYSQSGQLRDILDSVLRDVRDELNITFATIEPGTPWPFPWKAHSFFDAMPESVVQEPAPVRPLPAAILHGDYDLVLLGWQPWFLHPSQPMTAFLQSADAKLLEGKPVVTVAGCRNMWLNAGEVVKKNLHRVGASHVGNIVLSDTNTNLVSLLTIIRWNFSGRKEASRWLPAAGVQDADIKAAHRFGKPVAEAARALAEARYTVAGAAAHLAAAYPDERASDEFRAEMPDDGSSSPPNGITALPAVAGLHQKLLALGAVPLNTGLVLLEQRGIKNFRFWAKYIREKGGPKSESRRGRVTNFKRLLLVAIFVLSPISSLTAAIQRNLRRKRLLKDVDYFKSLAYEPGRI